MRILSFLLTFTFVMAGVSVAGTTDRLPGVGTFSYNGTPIVMDAPVVIASR